MTFPPVSVVIPSRNYGHYLGTAIQSALGQEEVETHVIVVDDGSEDNTPDVVADFGDVDLIRQRHSGVGAARNTGVAQSRCDLIAFLDADDLWAPDKLRRQIPALSRQPTRTVVYGWVREFLSQDVEERVVEELSVRPEPYLAPIPSTLLLHRETFEVIGEFREDRHSGEALDWVLRLREQNVSIQPVDAVVTMRRVHASNSGRANRPAQHQEYVRAVRRSLGRRRSTEEDTG